jgi:hypothetical protein
MLAGVRGIRPRPVGFKFHAVLVVNSAHLASLAAEDRDRWLPLLWAADYFKRSQQENRDQGDWRMAAVAESHVPAPDLARRRFAEAMDNWDEDAADAAVVGLGRSEGAAGVWEQLWKYGARDFRDIGHKAIYVANAWRTLQTIGWRHREPILRSIAFALLDRGRDDGNPSQRDLVPDRPGRANLPRANRFARSLITGRVDRAASLALLQTLRTASADAASREVEGLLDRGTHPNSIWDGLFMHAGELLMRQPGIVGLHTLTTTNALHFGYFTTAEPTTRAFLLLQAAAFLTMFRDALPSRGQVGTGRLDQLERADVRGEDAITEILTDVSQNRTLAARKTLALVSDRPEQARALMHQARRLVFAKGTDSHDYKFSSAVLEDYLTVAPQLRPYFLAASMFYLKGSRDRDNGLITRARAALRG